MFENIPKIEKPEFYIELGMRSAKRYASSRKLREKVKSRRIAELEIIKADAFTRSVGGCIGKICSSFPTIDQLPIFYKELLEAMVGINELKVSIARMQGAAEKIESMAMDYKKRIKSSDTEYIAKKKREFYGRAFSMLKKSKAAFSFAENARKDLRQFPSIKTKILTICICGYPNVGKSTLLSKLTGSRPDIAPYAFTTRQLMIGYIANKIQIIDTPGNFKEDFKKMNWIEKQSYLAIKHLCKKIIYVFDITETCGFTISQQEELFNKLVKKFRAKQFSIYLSKSDMGLDKKQEFEDNNKNHKIFDDADKLKAFLLED
ncbi:MAG: 50S ribosome-binding GTPase [Nanoarchaeota archaeon]|nr:50S ribosome-binding GTPase [Nanoarchaeota archaeon]